MTVIISFYILSAKQLMRSFGKFKQKENNGRDSSERFISLGKTIKYQIQ